MTSESAPVPNPPGTAARLFGVLTGVTVLSASALALVNNITAAPIAAAEKEAELRAVRAVLPTFAGEPTRQAATVGERSHAYDLARDSGGAVVGAAIQSTTNTGYSGRIDIIVGVAPDGAVAGVQVLRHLETPGLGAKITEAAFLDQYKGKRLGYDFRVKKDKGRVDAITGATISSRAVSAAVEDALEAHAAIPAGDGGTP
jgi:electron transport complex protein RnfG